MVVVVYRRMKVRSASMGVCVCVCVCVCDINKEEVDPFEYKEEETCLRVLLFGVM